MLTIDSKNTVGQVNQAFYDGLWSKARLIDPARFNTWPIVSALARSASMRLEVGPGMRPRLPIKDTYFADISEPALSQLAAQGGITQTASVTDLPYADNTFDLVCALDIIEHVENDVAALAELCRVAAPNATVLLSTPLHAEFWTEFDALVGHYRRYEPTQLQQLLSDARLTVEQSAGYGMKPKSSLLVNWGMQQLQKNPKQALWFYNTVLMPLGLRSQKPLALQPAMVNTDQVSEVFLVCRLNK